MRKQISWLYDRFFFAQTKNIYGLPVHPSVHIKNILFDWPSHTGVFRGAVDFAVDLGTPVLVPLDGLVIGVVDSFEKHGPTEKYANYLNYVTIAHSNGEYSQLAHIAKGSVIVRKGQLVKKGQQLGVTGLNGWMEEPFLEHVHMFVFKLLPDKSFKGLKIRFSDESHVS